MDKFTCTITIMCTDEDPDVLHAEMNFQPHWWDLEKKIKAGNLNWPRAYLVGAGVMNFLEQVGRIEIVDKEREVPVGSEEVSQDSTDV